MARYGSAMASGNRLRNLILVVKELLIMTVILKMLEFHSVQMRELTLKDVEMLVVDMMLAG